MALGGDFFPGFRLFTVLPQGAFAGSANTIVVRYPVVADILVNCVTVALAKLCPSVVVIIGIRVTVSCCPGVLGCAPTYLSCYCLLHSQSRLGGNL